MKNPIDITAPLKGEPALLVPVLLIAGLGIAMVYSASADISREIYGTPVHYAVRQALFLAMGTIAMYAAAWFPHPYLKKLVRPLLVLALALMAAVLTPLGVEAGGALRWLTLNGITFQPSEFAKLALIIYLAASLAAARENIRAFHTGFFPHALVAGIFIVLLMCQKDLGGIAIIGCIGWSMMFIAGVPLLHLFSVILPLMPFSYFFIYNVPYRMERISTFFHPWQDTRDTGYQLTHSLKAFGSGGLFGKGIGAGFQTEQYLPKPHTDFIFSVVGEELGLVGVLFILVLYTVVLKRGAAIARSADSLFGSLLAAGITAQLGIQVVINIGVTLGLLPTKGLTLPFISYGGTSLLMSMTAMGILMNIGRSTAKPVPGKPTATSKKEGLFSLLFKRTHFAQTR